MVFWTLQNSRIIDAASIIITIPAEAMLNVSRLILTLIPDIRRIVIAMLMVPVTATVQQLGRPNNDLHLANCVNY